MTKYQIQWSYHHQDIWFASQTFATEAAGRAELAAIKSSSILTDDAKWRLVKITERVIG